MASAFSGLAAKMASTPGPKVAVGPGVSVSRSAPPSPRVGSSGGVGLPSTQQLQTQDAQSRIGSVQAVLRQRRAAPSAQQQRNNQAAQQKINASQGLAIPQRPLGS